MYGIGDPERIKLNNQIKEWNSNRLDLFQISEPNDYLEFYGVMRFFYQGDDLKYQTKCLRVSSTATTSDVHDALREKFHPDLKMLNNDKYQLYESHNLEDRKMKKNEHPLLVQLNWALEDKDGKFIFKNESRRRRSIDVTNHDNMHNYPMSRSTSTLTNGFESQPLRTHSTAVYSNPSKFLKRFASLKKSKRKSKTERDAIEDVEDAKRLAEEISGKPPESSFTRTISNPDDVMKRRRQKKLESRLEQFSSPKGDGETGGTLKIYGESINPDIPYKTLLLSVNDTAEKVLAETLDKYGLSSEDHRFFVLVQQNIPSRDDKNRGNVEEIILHDQDCPLGILVHCPPKRGSATFAVRRVKPSDQFPSTVRMPPSTLSKEPSLTKSNNRSKVEESTSQRLSSSPTTPDRYSNNAVEYPRLKQIFVDADGSLYDVQNGIFSLSSLVTLQLNQSLPSEGSKFIKIGSQSSTVGGYPNVLLMLNDYPDIRPVHCHISAKLDSKVSSMKLQLTPTLDTTSRTPRPCVTFINEQRIDNSTRLVNGDMIQLGESVIFRFEEFDDETQSNDDTGIELIGDEDDLMQISYFTADLPVTVMYNYSKSQILIDNAIQSSKKYAQTGCKELFGTYIKLEINNLDETFRLGPAYMFYLILRATLGDEQEVIQLINWIADRISQIIKEESNSVEKEIFWLSNTSELLHLLQYDNDLRKFSVAAQDVLASAIERAFSIVQHQFSQDLLILLPSVLGEDDLDIEDDSQEDSIPCRERASVLNQRGAIDYPVQQLLQTLSLAYTLFHNCQVNVALTIQMFSQLFHLLNTWLFNSVLGDQQSDTDSFNAYPLPVCQEWGNRLSRRLNRIRNWSELNGLEMAANCHLQKMYQVAELMEADKRDLNVFGEKCIEMVNLNGAQLHHLLISCQDYDLPEAWIEVVVNTAIQLHDNEFNDNTKSKAFPQNKNTLPLYEDMDLRLPLLLPADGYCCDRGIVSCPTDLRMLLRSAKEILTYRLNPPVMDQIDTRWKSYLGTCESTPTVSRSNTVKEQSYLTSPKLETPHLPRNWVKDQDTNEDVSTSVTVSLPRERFQKKSNNIPQLSLYTNSQVRSSLPNPDKRLSSQSNSVDGSNPKSDIKNRFELKLSKINNSLGISIIALRANVNDINRIYVKDVIAGGAGFTCGMIAPGDQLVSIDNHLLENKTQDEAVAMMKKTKSDVVLLVQKGAALTYAVMDMIIQARKSKINTSSQKPQQRISNVQQPSAQRKPHSKSTPTAKPHSTKEEPQVKMSRSQITLPSLPTEQVPPRPPRISQGNIAKPSNNKVSDLDNLEPDFNSLPVRKPKANEPSISDVPVYATVNKKRIPNDNFSANYPSLQNINMKPEKSSSQPNLSIVPSSNRNIASSESNSSRSVSSDSGTSSEEEEPLKLKPLMKIQNIPKPNISAESNKIPQTSQKIPTKPSVKAVSETNIPQKFIGIPRHQIVPNENQRRASVPKKQIFSRPVISDTILNHSDEEQSMPLNRPLSSGSDKKKRQSSSSETLSSHTESTSSSDHSPQPQRKTIPEPLLSQTRNQTKPLPKQEPQSLTNEPISERRSPLGVVNLGGFKKPMRLTSSKSSEQLTDYPKILAIESPQSSPKGSSKVLNQNPMPKRKSSDQKPRPISTIQVNSHSPFIGVSQPPLPTALYPQYHPPDSLEENYPTLDNEIDVPTMPSEEEVRIQNKEIADQIRKHTEEKAKKIQPIEPQKPIDVLPPAAPAENKDKNRVFPKYGRPQFQDRSQSNRPTSLFKPELSIDLNSHDGEFKMPSPPPPLLPEGGIVVPPSPIIKSKVLGSNEVYKEPFKKNRNSEIDAKQDGAEELSFGEKMKLFAEKIGEEKVVNRNKFSSKQRKIDSEDFM